MFKKCASRPRPSIGLCRTQFIADDRTLTCNRPLGLHLVHHDATTGDRFARVPRGAWVWPQPEAWISVEFDAITIRPVEYIGGPMTEQDVRDTDAAHAAEGRKRVTCWGCDSEIYVRTDAITDLCLCTVCARAWL